MGPMSLYIIVHPQRYNLSSISLAITMCNTIGVAPTILNTDGISRFLCNTVGILLQVLIKVLIEGCGSDYVFQVLIVVELI